MAGVLALAVTGCIGGSSSATPTPSPTATATATATLTPTPLPTSTPTPTATPVAPASIDLQSEVSTVYYDVTGTTRVEIFASMEANGPDIEEGTDALGLAAWNWNVPSVRTRVAQGACELESFSMTVELVVTLPRHINVAGLAPEVAARWQALAASVAAHEQSHVDVVLNGMDELEAKLAALESRSTCRTLEEEIRDLWSGQNDIIEVAQDAFHTSDQARIEAERGPLQALIDANRAQLAALESDIDALDVELADIESQIAQIEAAYPDRVLPPDEFSRYEALLDDFNARVPVYNSLVNQHTALVSETNLLIEDLNWIQ